MTESLPPEDPRAALIREQAALIAALSAQVTDLSAQLAELTGLVRELRGQLEAAGRVAELGELLDAAVVGRPAGPEGARAAGEARQRAQAGQAAGRPGRTSCLVADTGRDGGAVPGGLVPVRPGPHGRG